MMRAMTKPAHSTAHKPLVGIIFTIIMVALLTFSTHLIAREISVIMVLAILAAVAASSYLLPGSPFFTLALANIIAVYASFFVIILDSDFRSVPQQLQWLGFIMPLVGFFIGILLQRKTISRIVQENADPDPASYAHAVLVLLPLALTAIIAMAYAGEYPAADGIKTCFIIAMGVTSVVAFIASRDVAIFLLITGQLFESFFKRIANLMAPIFAFFTFYSFTVLLFAAVYSGIDQVTGNSHFRVLGNLQSISFPEALYFSIATLATVGYGDIVPASNLMRLISSFEVICGVMLLLFGFNEILTHAKEHRRHAAKDKTE